MGGGVAEGAGWEIREGQAGMWLFLASLQFTVCTGVAIIKNLIINSLFLEDHVLNIILHWISPFISSAV